MIVLHYIPSIDRASGGVAAYMQLLARGLGRLVDLHVATHRSEYEVKLENCTLHYLPLCRWFPWKTKAQFLQLIDDLHPDIFHTNSCWEPLSSFTLFWAKAAGISTIYTTHGMLEPWIMQHNYYRKKWPALRLYQRRALAAADRLVATAERERTHLLEQGYNHKVAIVPNAVDVQDIRMKDSWQLRKQILLLSRLHPVKGIDFLLEAVVRLKEDLAEYQIVVAGDGDSDYVNHLKQRAQELGICHLCKFKGGVYGDEKWRLYQESDFLVLPSFTENFGIVVAESLASGTPVVTTQGTPWSWLETYACGKWIKVGVEPLVDALQEMLSMDARQLELMGRNGRRLVMEKFAVDVVARQMVGLYQDVSGNG